MWFLHRFSRYTIDPETAGKYVIYVEKQPLGNGNDLMVPPSSVTPPKMSKQHYAGVYEGSNGIDLDRNNSSSSASTLLARPIKMTPSPDGHDNNALSEMIDMNEIYVVDETNHRARTGDILIEPSTSADSGKLVRTFMNV
jgi:hypothetical protein